MSFKISNSTEYFNVLNSSRVKVKNMNVNTLNSTSLTVSGETELNGGLSNDVVSSTVTIFFNNSDASSDIGTVVSNCGLLSGSLQIPFTNTVTASALAGYNYVEVALTDTNSFLNPSNNYSILISYGVQETSSSAYSSLVELGLYGAVETTSSLKLYLSPLTDYDFVNGNVLSLNYLITKIN